MGGRWEVGYWWCCLSPETMGKFIWIGGLLMAALALAAAAAAAAVAVGGVRSEGVREREFWRSGRREGGEEGPLEERLFGVAYKGASRYRGGESQERRQVEESRPLCEEERKSVDVRELIYSSAANFIQTSGDVNLRRYHLIPRKVDVIRCLSGHRNGDSEAVCKPENCRERKVDIEVFGRLRNETGNLWEFVGTLSAVPVACECFVRWKPHKCSRSVDVFYDF